MRQHDWSTTPQINVACETLAYNDCASSSVGQNRLAGTVPLGFGLDFSCRGAP